MDNDGDNLPKLTRDEESLTEEDDFDLDEETLARTFSNGPSMVGSYREPSFTFAGSRARIGSGSQESQRVPTQRETHEARREERCLLRDNNIIPPKRPQPRGSSDGSGQQSSQHLTVPSFTSSGIEGGRKNGTIADEERATSETTPLLDDPNPSYGGQESDKNLENIWREAVTEGKIQTNWRRETKVIARYSAPLILTFLLQYSLTVASIFTVGHLGTVELGAVSLASMTANITGYAIYQGLATSLDTLCAQAYGSGRKKLVGLQTQRMVFFLWTITIPIGIIWLCADIILMKIVPEKDVAVLAGRYLKIVLLGAPGYATFESAKRFLQAQGIFSASLYVLIICAPLNALMNWLFVWVCNQDSIPYFASPKLHFHYPQALKSVYRDLCIYCTKPKLPIHILSSTNTIPLQSATFWYIYSLSPFSSLLHDYLADHNL